MEVSGFGTVDKVILANNLMLEVGHFLQDSLLLNSKESAVWKLALLWNLALQLNDLQTEIFSIGCPHLLPRRERPRPPQTGDPRRTRPESPNQTDGSRPSPPGQCRPPGLASASDPTQTSSLRSPPPLPGGRERLQYKFLRAPTCQTSNKEILLNPPPERKARRRRTKRMPGLISCSRSVWRLLSLLFSLISLDAAQ